MTTAQPVLSLPDAERLAERTLAAIDTWDEKRLVAYEAAYFAADRARVASDLAGLREHDDRGWGYHPSCAIPCPDARRYSDGLRRTAALYGVEL